MKKKVVSTLRHKVKVKVNIFTSDDIKIYYTKKFQDFTARYIIKRRRYLLITFLFSVVFSKKTNISSFVRPARVAQW